MTNIHHCSYLPASFREVGVAPYVRGQYYRKNWQISYHLQDKIYCFSHISCYVTPPSSLVVCKIPLLPWNLVNPCCCFWVVFPNDVVVVVAAWLS